MCESNLYLTFRGMISVMVNVIVWLDFRDDLHLIDSWFSDREFDVRDM